MRRPTLCGVKLRLEPGLVGRVDVACNSEETDTWTAGVTCALRCGDVHLSNSMACHVVQTSPHAYSFSIKKLRTLLQPTSDRQSAAYVRQVQQYIQMVRLPHTRRRSNSGKQPHRVCMCACTCRGSVRET